jgi:hypothetical protein
MVSRYRDIIESGNNVNSTSSVGAKQSVSSSTASTPTMSSKLQHNQLPVGPNDVFASRRAQMDSTSNGKLSNLLIDFFHS